MDNLHWIITVDVAVTLLLSRVLLTTHVYVPANALVTLGTLKTPTRVITGIPFGSRTSDVVISKIFLVMQTTLSNSPSLSVTLGNNGCIKTIRTKKHDCENKRNHPFLLGEASLASRSWKLMTLKQAIFRLPAVPGRT